MKNKRICILRAEEANLKTRYSNLLANPSGYDLLQEISLTRAKIKNKQLREVGNDRDGIPMPQDLPRRKVSHVGSLSSCLFTLTH